jgi:hypothetical protein
VREVTRDVRPLLSNGGGHGRQKEEVRREAEEREIGQAALDEHGTRNALVKGEGVVCLCRALLLENGVMEACGASRNCVWQVALRFCSAFFLLLPIL